jgi:hypothetical protein
MDVTDWIFWGAIACLLLLFEPVRSLIGAVFKTLAPHQGAWSFIKNILHAIYEAHACLLRNLRPRKVVFLELGDEPTSGSNQNR